MIDNNRKKQARILLIQPYAHPEMTEVGSIHDLYSHSGKLLTAVEVEMVTIKFGADISLSEMLLAGFVPETTKHNDWLRTQFELVVLKLMSPHEAPKGELLEAVPVGGAAKKNHKYALYDNQKAAHALPINPQ